MRWFVVYSHVSVGSDVISRIIEVEDDAIAERCVASCRVRHAGRVGPPPSAYERAEVSNDERLVDHPNFTASAHSPRLLKP